MAKATHPRALLRRARLWSVVRRRRLRHAAEASRHPGFTSAELVSFDVFDTALRRSVAQPVDVFALTAWRLSHRGTPPPPNFAASRIAAEFAARARAEADGRHEVTLEEIYACLETDAATRAACKAEELATERDVLHANPDILRLYQTLRARGVAVVFVSDIYLPADFLRQVLHRAGFDGNLSVFASADSGQSKAHGSLYAQVARALGVAPRHIWHIGDNARVDVLAARRAGWNALWYHPEPVTSQARLPAGQDAVEAMTHNLLQGVAASLADAADTRGTDAVWRRIGYHVAGPLYLGFALWLRRAFAHDRPDRILFCARDGRIVREVYHRLLAADAIATAAPPDTYLMVSRRALVFPLLTQIDAAALAFLCDQFANPTVGEVLERIGLDPQILATSIAAHGLEPTQRIDTEPRRQALHALLGVLAPAILARAATERAVLDRYLAQSGCRPGQRLALVDVGWKATLQVAAAKLLGPASPITGYYFGTSQAVDLHPPGTGPIHGWFVDRDRPADRAEITRWQCAILELLFTAPHGSVLGYAEQGDTIDPVLQEIGAAEYEAAAAHIQDAALAFVDRVLAALGGAALPAISPDALTPSVERLVLRPSLAEARALGDLFHVDGFGATRTGQFIAKPASLRQAAARYRAASWRRGFLVRLCGGWPTARLAIATLRLVRPGFTST